MSFANWKKRSKLFQMVIKRVGMERLYVEDVAAAAYKAGQRDAMKVAEEIAKNAILYLQGKDVMR
jgi:hypothetical protein